MLKKVTLAVSAALVSTSAFALQPSDFVSGTTLEVFVSGASAEDKAIGALFENICVDADSNGVADDLSVYKDNVKAGSEGKAHTAYFCTVDATKVSGMSGNRPVLFHKRSAGGSGQGVAPILSHTAIEAMRINNGNCSLQSGNATSGTYFCSVSGTNDVTMAISDAGVSDVNPELFVGGNVPAGYQPVDAAEVKAKLHVQGAAALVFGIPVTTALRDALQAAEVADGTMPSTCVGNDTNVDCMPTLSKPFVQSVMLGSVNSWSELKNKNGDPITNFDQHGGTAIAKTTDVITVCRRVPGSGTQAQMGVHFLNYPCTAGAKQPARARTTNPFLGNSEIIENSGSGDVEVCLDNAQAAGKWGIGLQSTEKNANHAHDYRFVKINGVAPTLANAASGDYFDVAENTFQWRVDAGFALAGDKLAIVQTIANDGASPTIVRDTLNPKFNFPWGQAGYLSLSKNGHTPTFPFDATTNPVTTLTHTVSGSLDNCTVPVVDGSKGLTK